MVVAESYRCLRELAGGGSSNLYLAEQIGSGQQVALKVLRATDASSISAFEHEQQLITKLGSPHAPRIFATGKDQGRAYVAMEYFPLGDLRRSMTGPLLASAALSMLMRIALALRAVHDAGVLHRDLKPGNILLRADGSVALCDFGVAAQLANAGAAANAELRRIVGTPEYMSPEQGHGEALDVRSDLYSLGVILYEMLRQRRPFTGVPPLQIFYLARHAPRPTLDAEQAYLQDLLDGLLASRREARFANAAVVLNEMRALRGKS
jgi:eukaryotic-like serine/threonine-protein kinase